MASYESERQEQEVIWPELAKLFIYCDCQNGKKSIRAVYGAKSTRWPVVKLSKIHGGEGHSE